MIERGYCRDKQQEQDLRMRGISAQLIWLEGRGAECLEWCLRSFRGRPGHLFLAGDLRVFDKKKAAVAAIMARLEKAHIRVIDVTHPEHQTISEMLQFAFVRISGSRFDDRRRARRQGRAGGEAKGAAARARRDELVPDAFVRRLVGNRAIVLADKLQVLGPGFSEATLRRHYGLSK